MELLSDADIRQIPCRDHLAAIDLAPAGYMKQLKHLAALDERVDMLLQPPSKNNQNQNKNKNSSTNNATKGSELLLGSTMNRNELMAMLAFTYESGRDVVRYCNNKHNNRTN